VAAAAVRACDTAATLALETRETRALTSTPVADPLVAALAVEVCLIPLLGVVLTGKTVGSIILFADEAIGILVADLLVGVDPGVGINVTKWRVDERLSEETQTIGAIVSEEIELTFTHASSVANAVA